uniref:Oxidoreductase with FAD/NAD(P)-binding domain n=1 Tax=Magnetococcus massalia (strain MO-1) TaxID=451514 RepID=A0A1S7LG17_MAGMO|nr:conserved protein of unknown function [Candidatus Magnetococcus massalia]
MSGQDLLIIGAGAAGLVCAIEAAQRGKRVTVLDHAKNPGEKIRISGGGRCNFTNLYTDAENYLSANPKFCISALHGYTPYDFMARLDDHRIRYEEREHGQLFCKGSATQIVEMLLKQAADAGVFIKTGHSVKRAHQQGAGYRVESGQGSFSADQLVIASGGLSIPKMGATDIGHRIAKSFDLALEPTRPALCPFTFEGKQKKLFAALSGLSVDARVSNTQAAFSLPLLFTHRGLSGPAILQLSSYWQQGESITLDLLPGEDAFALLQQAKQQEPKIQVATLLGRKLPKRLAQVLAQGVESSLAERPDRELKRIADGINRWSLRPAGLEGYRTAEVTAGGVSTELLSSKTMQVKALPGLYFIGEVVDVTGQLGGYNFQWAWSSGIAAGRAV